jgi:hypothetical protein
MPICENITRRPVNRHGSTGDGTLWPRAVRGRVAARGDEDVGPAELHADLELALDDAGLAEVGRAWDRLLQREPVVVLDQPGQVGKRHPSRTQPAGQPAEIPSAVGDEQHHPPPG